MTKIIIKSAVATLFISAMITGCSSNKPTVENQEFPCTQDGVVAPNFTCNPYAEGSIVALGIAQMNAGNDKAFQRTEAIGSGRDELARQIEIKVSNLLKQYRGVTGAGIEATFDKASTDVSKQLASQTLNSSKQIGISWMHPETKELFILVGINNEPVKTQMEKAIKTSFKNDEAMYQRFLAEKANGDLDKELEKANY